MDFPRGPKEDFFPGGGKSVEVSFYQLETKRKTSFY